MRRTFRHFDWLLCACTLVLTAFGVAMIFSAGPAQETGFVLDEFYLRQGLYALVGFAGMFLLAAIDYRIWETWPRLPYLATLAILALVAASGQSAFASQRWFNLGLFPVQPSEAAKILLIVSLAKYLADRESDAQRWYHIVVSLVLVAIPMGLVYLQPNLGTSIVLGTVGVGMLFMWGIRARYVALLAAAGIAALVLVGFTATDYQRQRLVTFLNPDDDPLGSGYNVLQARISIGSGGWTGQGFLSGTQSRLRFLRARHTDFIFSVVAEELGLIGCAVFIGLMTLVLWRMLRAAQLAGDGYGRLLAIGLVVMLFFQTAVNLGMNVGLLPVTGIPLPFLSFGGSSIISVLLGQGLIQSIIIHHRKLEFD
ncbi:MAG: rod shape-determining protein RodA [Chloroflexi bacterium]|nr:rod shape-determining protein RodA [Chloroflexota bacterium]